MDKIFSLSKEPLRSEEIKDLHQYEFEYDVKLWSADEGIVIYGYFHIKDTGDEKYKIIFNTFNSQLARDN